jgi:alpha-glucoside transport system permease protein
LQFVLIALGLLWLVPTIGLLVTSLLSPLDFQVSGWWQVFSALYRVTWSNYDAIFHNSTILRSLLTTAEIAVGGTILPILIGSLAAYAFAWLDFPRTSSSVSPRI